ncbi:MAG TPA: AzlD domain-containing protein [Firmicutes bacterium]|nr:AzlD domain-containing protein [Bacillota bacterium]
MSTAEYVLVLVCCGAATYLTRMPALVLSEKARIPESVRRFMRFIGPAVITALIAPSVFLPDGTLNLNPADNIYLPAAVVTALTAFLTKKSLPAILAGVLTAFLLSLL